MRLVLGTFLILALILDTAVLGKKVKKAKSGKKKEPSFIVGKPNSQFCLEYPELNQVVTPKEAKKLCEDDLQCAGFCYKGAKDLGQRFDMKFFHYLPEMALASSADIDWTWTSYKVARPFVLLNARNDLLEQAKNDQELILVEEANDQKNPVIFWDVMQQQKYVLKKNDFNLEDYLDFSTQYSKWMIKLDLRAKDTKSLLTRPLSSCVKNEYSRLVSFFYKNRFFSLSC